MMCGCEAHQSGLAPCTCLCEEHDRHFTAGFGVVRKAIRDQASEMYQLQQRVGNLRYRLHLVENELASPVTGLSEASVRAMEESHNAWQPPSNEAVSSPPITGNDTTYWPPNPRESDGDLLARLGTDAMKWAEEFMQVLDRLYEEGGSTLLFTSLREGTALGWFANAIGAGEMKNAVALDYLRSLVGPDWRERAQRWFETTYCDSNTATAETATASDGMTDEEEGDALMAVLREERSPVGWEVVSLNAVLDPDAQIRLTIVGPAGEGWDGARAATEFHWDDAHTVTVEVMGGVGTIEEDK